MDVKSLTFFILLLVIALTSAVPPRIVDNDGNSELLRVRRQETTSTTATPPKRRPQNLFSLFTTLLRETRDDARRAFAEIGNMFNSQFASNTPSPMPKPSTSSTPAPADGEDVSTTTEPYRISRNEFNGILRSNIVGIGRLFGKELRNAISDSGKNLRQFGSELRTQIRPYVEIRNGNATISNQ